MKYKLVLRKGKFYINHKENVEEGNFQKTVLIFTSLSLQGITEFTTWERLQFSVIFKEFFSHL